MSCQKRNQLIQNTLDQLRQLAGLDSVMLVTREMVGPEHGAVMLFTSNVEDNEAALHMLSSAASFFPAYQEITPTPPDGRSRLQ